MKLTVITGVGPGHDDIVNRARDSVRMAIARNTQFDTIVHNMVDDTKGILGCAGARNAGMDQSPDADWFFFLDADDLMEPDALRLNDFSSPATFGAVKLAGIPMAKNVYPLGWRELAMHGAGGTLTVGFFCRADIARELRFDEDDEITDDFGLYLRLPRFTKIREPLCTTCVNVPSSVGPRRIGAAQKDWTGLCNEKIRQAVALDPAKFGLKDGELLSMVAATGWVPAA